jgi:hypothetical protein
MQAMLPGVLVLLVGAALAAAQEPPPLEVPETPPAAPAPDVPQVEVPTIPLLAAPTIPLLAAPTSLSGYLRPDQPPYGPLLPPGPAQNVAMLAAGYPLYPNDPRVGAAAVLLTRLTAIYVEDAPRISELAIRAVLDLRAANQTASPTELLEGATQWKRAGGKGSRGDVPRRFTDFVRFYRKLRVEEGKDHVTALSLMQPATSSSPSAGP